MLNDVKSALFLFYKYITRGNKGTLVLTILVATLAFIEINFISGILSGAVVLTYKQAQDVYVSNIVIQPGKDATGKSEDYIKQVNLLKNKIYAIPGVIDCCSRYSTGTIITYDPDKTGRDVRSISWPVKSINPDEEIRVIDIHNYMVAGRYLEDSDRDQLIMGREISGGYGAFLEVQTLKGANIGDEVTVYYHNGVVRDYKIKGIYATAFPFADMTIFVTQREMESVLGLHNRASEILIKTSPEYSDQYYLGQLRASGITTEDIRPWADFIGIISGITQSFDIIKRIVTFIGLIVAGVTIFIVIFIATTSRRKQIGIMKAIGMKEKIVIMSYMFLALFYALIGIGTGVALLEFLIKPYFISHPLSLPMGKVSLAILQNEFLTSIISMIVISVIAGFVPSRKVTRENIIKAIWG